MSLIGYMREDSIVFELENIMNAIFMHIAEGSGMKYFAFHMRDSGIYTTQDRYHITLDYEHLFLFVNQSLHI